MPIRWNGAGPVRPRVIAFVCLLLVALVACPQVHREPTLPPPPPGCEQGRSVCHQGAPWVCGPGGQWSVADRRCDPIGARCCLAESPFGGLRHACVPAALCVDGDGERLGADAGASAPRDVADRVKVDDPAVSGAVPSAGGGR
jgi:hypothetical protein